MDPKVLAGFAAASLVLLVIPGPAVTYILARSVEGGRRVGLASVVGVHIGTLVHVAAAVAGLSAILVSSAAAYSVLKYGGAAYLIFLGVQAIRRGGRPDGDRARHRPTTTARRALGDGVLVNVLNPKTAVFFLAYLPQFTRPDAGPVYLQLLVLGGIFIVIGLFTDGAYALGGSELGRRFGPRWRGWRRREQLAGAVYVGLGVLTLALPGRRAPS